MTLKDLITMFMEIVHDDKIYFTLISKETNKVLVESNRLFNKEFEPYHDYTICSVIETAPINAYIVVCREDIVD